MGEATDRWNRACCEQGRAHPGAQMSDNVREKQSAVCSAALRGTPLMWRVKKGTNEKSKRGQLLPVIVIMHIYSSIELKASVRRF